MPRRKAILFLGPQIYGAPGGVQTYMRRLREILSLYGQQQDYHVHALSLMDRDEDESLHSHPVSFSRFEHAAGNKLGFGLKAWKHSIRFNTRLAVVGHLGQSPVAWSLKQIGLLGRYILVLHGIEAWRRVPFADRRAASGAVRIVATTNYTAEEFSKQNGIRTDLIQVIPLSLAEQEIDLPLDRRSNDLAFRVLTVARLAQSDSYKGVDYLIRAMAVVRGKGHKVHLNIVGDGDDVPRLSGIASELALPSDTVSFYGLVPQDKLRSLYRECDVLALPSRNEGFGLVFLEAMRYGKPCIGGNHGGTPEVITHGIDGFLVEHGDIKRLAEYLCKLSQDHQLREQLGQNAYRKVKDEFLFPHMQANWFSLLDEALK